MHAAAHLERGICEVAASNVHHHHPRLQAFWNLPILQPPHQVGCGIPCRHTVHLIQLAEREKPAKKALALAALPSINGMYDHTNL